MRRIRAELIERNGLTHIVPHPLGLGDKIDRSELKILHGHSGSGTMGSLQGEGADTAVTERHAVEVRTGDEQLLSVDQSIVLVKIDVEGLELSVVKGMTEVLRKWRPALYIETVASHLERAGTDVSDLHQSLRGLGYAPYVIRLTKRGLRHEVRFEQETPESSDTNDVLWIHPQSEAKDRLVELLPALRQAGE